MKKKYIKVLYITCFFFILTSNIAFSLSGCGDEANPALKTICDVIQLLQGRIGRSIATFSIMLTAWKVSSGKLSWQELLQTAIGVGIFFAPKTFALFLLPDYIEGLSGEGYNPTTKYSPDEILTCVCPNLR